MPHLLHVIIGNGRWRLKIQRLSGMLLRHPCGELCNAFNLDCLHFPNPLDFHQLLHGNVMEGIKLPVLFKPVKDLLRNR